MLARRLILDFEGRRREGVRPFAVLESKNGAFFWTHRAGAFKTEFPTGRGDGDVLAEIQAALQWCRETVGPQGAAIGFMAYDAARSFEPRAFTSHSPPDDLHVPDLRLVFCEALQDVELPDVALPEAGSRPEDELPLDDAGRRAAYVQDVRRIQEWIAAGDIYQANLTQRWSAPLSTSPDALYEALRARHPMPFAALLEWDDLAVVSNSPERFLTLRGRMLTAQPIKGTMRRGVDAEEDERLKRALQNSVKDRAENVMIVDLLRNDMGRVCEWGSIQVPQLFQAQTFPTLHHLVSTVTGTLRADLDGVDAFRAAFPCGSITGAPKMRAMQILDELEPVRRGIAMGAIGFWGFDGDMEWNVAIRTITCRNGTATFHTGGGIVADSDPDAEYEEMRLKALALRRGLSSFQF